MKQEIKKKIDMMLEARLNEFIGPGHPPPAPDYSSASPEDLHADYIYHRRKGEDAREMWEHTKFPEHKEAMDHHTKHFVDIYDHTNKRFGQEAAYDLEDCFGDATIPGMIGHNPHHAFASRTGADPKKLEDNLKERRE